MLLLIVEGNFIVVPYRFSMSVWSMFCANFFA